MNKLLKLIFLLVLFGPQVSNAADSLWVKVELRTDNSALALSWKLSDDNGSVVLSSGALTNNTTHIDSIYLPTDSCFHFEIIDNQANGIDAPGYLKIYEDGVLIVDSVPFTDRAEFYLNCQEGQSCINPTAILSEGFIYAGFEVNWYTFSPDSTGIYKISTCGIIGCDSKMWLYDNCPIELKDGPEGALAYNDNKCLLEAEISSYLQKDSLYYIRVEDNANSCSGPMFFTLISQEFAYGCLDTLACNYDPIANTDDGNCAYYPSSICHPDLAVDGAELKASLLQDTVMVLTSDKCLIEEGCVTGYGRRDIVKFSTQVENKGGTDFYIGNPRDNPEEFSNTNCHGHYHYEGYAEYFLINKAGYKIPIGFKNGFCLMDSECETGTAKFNCQTQGISKSCNDLYDYKTECQWIDITDIPEGQYTLVNRINGNRKKDTYGRYELDYENNWAQVCLKVSRSNGKASIELLDDCIDFYDCHDEKFGRSTIDCNGDCDGDALYGDVFQDGKLDDKDVTQLRRIGLNESSFAYSCLDLNQDGRINIADAFNLEECISHTDSVVHEHDHLECVFPKINGENGDSVIFEIDAINRDSSYFVVTLNSNGKSISNMQLDFKGISIQKVQTLISLGSIQQDQNSIQILSGDSSFNTSIPEDFVKIYYKSTGLDATLSVKESTIALDNEGRLFNVIPALNQYVLGVEKMILNNPISLYPNPTRGEVKVVPHPSISDYQISIFSVQGKMIFSAHNIQNTLDIDTENWESGVYFVRFFYKGFSKSVKLIKF